MYTIWEIETQNLWLTQMPSQGEWQIERFLFVLAPIGFLWNNLWSVSRYVMGPLSGRWRQSGNDQQCLAAPIWKYRSGFGDHRFNFFIDLRPNYTFYTNLTNIVHWVVAYRDVAHLVRLNLEKSWENSAKSFDAGLITLRYFRQCQRSNHGDYVEETGIKNNKTRQSTNMWLYRLKHDANLINVSGHLGVSEIFSGIICCSIASEISTRFHLL